MSLKGRQPDRSSTWRCAQVTRRGRYIDIVTTGRKLRIDRLDLQGLQIHGNEWQGKKDSNLRMSESKSGALTNLAIPLRNLLLGATQTRILSSNAT